MRSPLSHTAVLLFALPDTVEAGRKPIARQPDGVWQAMRRLTQAKVVASGLPLLPSARLIGHEGTFGQQLSTAVTAAFAQGYDQIICIGNDCPDLSVTDLHRAARLLTQNKLPIGADHRGGVYLVGFCRQQFDGHSIAGLPWQTASLAVALRSCLVRQNGLIAELPVRADLNRRTDATAVRWSNPVARRLLLRVRQALVLVVRPSVSFRISLVASVSNSPVCGRAPPRF